MASVQQKTASSRRSSLNVNRLGRVGTLYFPEGCRRQAPDTRWCTRYGDTHESS